MIEITIGIIAIFLGAWIIYGVTSFAPWVPTRTHDLARIEKAIVWDNVRVFYDVGSGTGHVLRYFAHRHPHVQFIGVEISLLLYVLSHIRNLRYPNITTLYGDAYVRNYSAADVVYVFGTQHTVNHRVRRDIVSQVKSEAQIVLYNFTLNNWPGTKHEFSEHGKTMFTIYQK